MFNLSETQIFRLVTKVGMIWVKYFEIIRMIAAKSIEPETVTTVFIRHSEHIKKLNITKHSHSTKYYTVKTVHKKHLIFIYIGID